MAKQRFLFVLLAGVMLAACAEAPNEPRMIYGPPTPQMTPSTGMGSFRGMPSWTATDEHYRSATPAPFRGF